VQPRTYIRIYTDLRIQPRMNVLSGCGNYEERPDDRPARSWDLRILVSEGLIEREKERERDEILDYLDNKSLAFISLVVVVKFCITSYLLFAFHYFRLRSIMFDYVRLKYLSSLSRYLLSRAENIHRDLFIHLYVISL